MNILAFDTSSEILSVALSTPGPRGEEHVLECTRDLGLRHSQILLPLVRQLLSQAGIGVADLDLVGVMRGPGSFTGLRIGMASAKGLAAAISHRRGTLPPPVVSVPTLEVMAACAPQAGALVVPVIDARKKRFYAALFRDGTRLTLDLDISATDLHGMVADHPGPVLITGPHADRLSLGDSGWIVDPEYRRGYAARLLEMAERRFNDQGADEPDRGPDYLRGSDAEISRNGPTGRS